MGAGFRPRKRTSGNKCPQGCPCGHLGDSAQECECSERAIENYRARISGPLLDRIDMHVEVPALSLEELQAAGGAAGSSAARDRIERARVALRARDQREVNATLPVDRLESVCAVDRSGQALLESAFERLGLSARALHRILRVARTIADLDGEQALASAHLAEAIQYRALDRRAR